ncbi:unnamed protein product [Mytilus edulis]|uniref:Uncharacterized protein n=1 Tax=Mytilus edulis TaxID=6550 RepID=A0A8S3SY29_MYTED|nr:unnamed protein product [Mytilus edulis]
MPKDWIGRGCKNEEVSFVLFDMSDLSGGGSIYSGSKGEGLDLKGSDLDLMFIDTNFKVYESETKVILDGLTIPLIMNTEETQPCFTQLRLLHHQHLSHNFKYLCQKNHLGNIHSSEHVLNKNKLEITLKDLYEQGIHCFTSSDTLGHYERQSYNITESLTSETFINMIRNGLSFAGNGNIKKVIYHCLHHSITSLSKSLFPLYLSMACRFAPDDASIYGYSSENKDQYYKYKYDRSQFLIGSRSDAVSGWLRLASFFYVHRNYVASLRVINHAEIHR